uniref:Uncharacterized protein n=1 Tax=Glossina brevipalpis TaxID=37001 RepID=A0A1A9X4V1_9MUSC
MYVSCMCRHTINHNNYQKSKATIEANSVISLFLFKLLYNSLIALLRSEVSMAAFITSAISSIIDSSIIRSSSMLYSKLPSSVSSSSPSSSSSSSLLGVSKSFLANIPVPLLVNLPVTLLVNLPVVLLVDLPIK